jgi:hypothetical protein
MTELDGIVTTALRDLAEQAAPPRLNAGALWRAGRRRRWAAITAPVAAVAAVAVLVPLAVLSAPAHPVPGPALIGSGSTHRPPPIQFRQVARIADRSCPSRSHGLPSTSKDECFYFTHTAMTIRTFASVTITQPSPGTSGYWLSFRLERADTRRYADLTQKLQNLPSPRDQLAIIANGVVLFHPEIVAPLDFGVFQIYAGHTRAQAQQLLHRLEHRVR